MPRLPNADRAIIDPRKISEYLLAPNHARGKGKAWFLADFGFTREAATALRDALLRHARTHEVSAVQTSQHGTKYTVQGPMPAPDGRAPNIRAIWIIDNGTDVPRFVTAFPGRRIRP